MAHNRLPEIGYVRLHQIVGNPLADPAVPPIVPVSKSTWWAGVKSGRFPTPVKLGPRITAWRVEDIHALIDSFSREIEASPWDPPSDSFSTHSSKERRYHD